MKKIFIILLISICAGVMQAQDSHYTVKNTTIQRSGNPGDAITRKLIASDSGSIIRFIHPEMNRRLWSLDSLIHGIINEHELTANSSDFEIIYAAGDFIKRSQVEYHNGGIDWYLPHQNHDSLSQEGMTVFSTKHPLSFTSINSKLCGEFNHQLDNLVSLLTQELNRDPIEIRGVSLPGHQTNEYWDTDLEKWVYLDVDPQSEVFIPRYQGNLVSVADIVNNNEILVDQTSFFHENSYGQFDSISTWNATNNTRRYVGNIEDIWYYTFEEISSDAYPNDIFYKLLPQQELIWEYDITSIYLEKFMLSNDCSRPFFLELMSFFEDSELLSTLDSASLINHALSITGKIAKCYDMDSMYLSYRILSEKIIFCDSTYYGINLDNEHMFKTTIPAGSYTSDDVYIPHLIHSISGGDIIFSDANITLEDGFNWIEPDSNFNAEIGDYFGTSIMHTLTQDFTIAEDITIYFLANERIQLVPDIAVFEGMIEVKNYVNNQLVEEASEPLSLSQNDVSGIKVYPNPAHQTLFISKEAHMKLHSIDGKIVAEKYGTSLDVSYLSKGMYILHIGDDKNNAFTSHKVIVN